MHKIQCIATALGILLTKFRFNKGVIISTGKKMARLPVKSLLKAIEYNQFGDGKLLI